MSSPSPLVLRLRALSAVSAPAVIDEAGATSHAELIARAAGVARALLEDAPSLEGRRVAILASAGATWLAGYFGVLLAGGVAVPLCPLHPDAELAFYVDDAEAGVVLFDADHASRLGAFASDVERRALEPLAVASTVPDVSIAASDVAELLYTSGTTGRPKGARITHSNVFVQASLLMEAWAVSPADRLLHALPLHHLHGLGISLTTVLLAGASARMLPRFDAARFWDELEGATISMGVPTMYHRLFVALDAADDATRARWTASAKRLRLATSGSAALPVSLAERWRAITGRIPVERFGMTEIGVGASNPREGERKAGTVGLPLPTV
jgi:malonyl-CoA/methylmalonyl-CoA synthetase